MRKAGLPILMATLLMATIAEASVITDSITRDRLVGHWAERGDCSRGGISFNDDGTFSVTGDYADADFIGTFDVKDGRLAGKAGDRVMPATPIQFSADGWLNLGPEQFARCTTPPPAPKLTPARP